MKSVNSPDINQSPSEMVLGSTAAFQKASRLMVKRCWDPAINKCISSRSTNQSSLWSHLHLFRHFFSPIPSYSILFPIDFKNASESSQLPKLKPSGSQWFPVVPYGFVPCMRKPSLTLLQHLMYLALLAKAEGGGIGSESLQIPSWVVGTAATSRLTHRPVGFESREPHSNSWLIKPHFPGENCYELGYPPCLSMA